MNGNFMENSLIVDTNVTINDNKLPTWMEEKTPTMDSIITYNNNNLFYSKRLIFFLVLNPSFCLIMIVVIY